MAVYHYEALIEWG